MNGYGLVLTNKTQSLTAPARKFFAANEGKTTYLIGAAQALSTSIASDQLANVEFDTTSDPAQIGTELSSRAASQGNRANQVFVSPSDQLASVAISAHLANQKRAVSLTAGSAKSLTTDSSAQSYLSLWASETYSVTLVGTRLTDSMAADVARPTLQKRSSPPAFHVTDVRPGDSSWTLSYTARTNAVKYGAYDLYGNLVASSSTTTMTIPNPQTAIIVVALDSAGTELQRFEYRANQYADNDDRESALLGSDSEGTSYLQILAAMKTPRVVTRVETDPFVEYSTPVSTTIAITCNSYFADEGLDPTKQYEYDLITGAGTANVACDPSASQHPTSSVALVSSKVVLPPTRFPTSSKAKSGDAVAKVRAATPTTTDADLLQAMSTPTLKSAAIELAHEPSLAVKSQATVGLPDYVIRYQGFIPEQYVPLPDIPSGDLFHPQLALGGDNRADHSHDPAGSYRFRIDALYSFSTGQITKSVSIGESRLYACSLVLTDCQLRDHGKQNDNTVNMPNWYISGQTGWAELTVHSAVPLLPGAPAIDADLAVTLSPGHSTIIGSHDRMPVHELYGGLAFSEFNASPLYQSDSHWVPCLFGGIASCTVDVNVSL
ncbi:MAG: hypothetical protein V4479_07865 [Actinomycetota bacterium]